MEQSSPCPEQCFDSNKIDRLVEIALEKLKARDSNLFSLDANERTICARFAMHLQSIFPDYDVDCEYNRIDRRPKSISKEVLICKAGSEVRDDDRDFITVYPDIIVHKRNTETNILVIEAKKSTNGSSNEYDLAKLKAYKKDLGYKFAKFIRFGVGDVDVTIEVSNH